MWEWLSAGDKCSGVWAAAYRHTCPASLGCTCQHPSWPGLGSYWMPPSKHLHRSPFLLSTYISKQKVYRIITSITYGKLILAHISFTDMMLVTIVHQQRNSWMIFFFSISHFHKSAGVAPRHPHFPFRAPHHAGVGRAWATHQLFPALLRSPKIQQLHFVSLLVTKEWLRRTCVYILLRGLSVHDCVRGLQAAGCLDTIYLLSDTHVVSS